MQLIKSQLSAWHQLRHIDAIPLYNQGYLVRVQCNFSNYFKGVFDREKLNYRGLNHTFVTVSYTHLTLPTIYSV